VGCGVAGWGGRGGVGADNCGWLRRERGLRTMELGGDGISLKIGAPRGIDAVGIGQPLLAHLLNPFW